MKILVTDGMDKSALAMLKANGHEVVEQFYAPEELGAALREFDAVVVRSGHQGPRQPHRRGQGREAEAHHPRRRGRGQHRREVRRGKRHHREEHPPRLLQLRGGAGHGPHVLLRPVHLHRRPHHAGGQVGEEGLRQGHGAGGQDPGHHRLRPHRPGPGPHGQGHRHGGHRRGHLPRPRHRGGDGHEVCGAGRAAAPRPTSSPSTPPPSTA